MMKQINTVPVFIAVHLGITNFITLVLFAIKNADSYGQSTE